MVLQRTPHDLAAGLEARGRGLGKERHGALVQERGKDSLAASIANTAVSLGLPATRAIPFPIAAHEVEKLLHLLVKRKVCKVYRASLLSILYVGFSGHIGR
jgi:hypothetical protein